MKNKTEKIIKKCYYCGKPNGKGPRETRPYGPGGADVCAECVFSDPKKEKIADEQFSKLLKNAEKTSKVIILTKDGPKPIVNIEDSNEKEN